jgi:hypothetical protein
MFTVALWGNSLVLSSVGARLRSVARLEPVTIDAALPDAVERLSALQPDVVVLELETARPGPLLALWKARPELLLIGVDLGTDRMLVLSGRPARALTTENLIETLTSHRKGQSPCTTI